MGQRFLDEADRMAQRIIFRASSPLGYTVALTRNRWREIVRFKHPAVRQYEDELKEVVVRPDVIRSSSRDPDVHLYYRQMISRKHLCVVVAPGELDERFVVTAYLTDRVKQGEELWKK
jgi:hypothetical protein